MPFHTVYIHALVLDEKGQKMSKSKGNVLDPLDLIDQYGADALRFTLTAMAAQGRDIKLSTGRIEGYRNFITKLWNAARYAEMNECTVVPDFDPAACEQTVNRWIVGSLVHAERQVTQAVEDYRFNDAASAVYQFTWHTFCDWYLEFTKPILTGDDERARAETRATTAWVLDQILHVLHPFAPYVTEELWQQLAPAAGRASPLIAGDWPVLSPALEAPDAAGEMDWLVRLISDIRAVRAEMNVPAAAKTALLVQGANADTDARINRHADLIQRLARVETIGPADETPRGRFSLCLMKRPIFCHWAPLSMWRRRRPGWNAKSPSWMMKSARWKRSWGTKNSFPARPWRSWRKTASAWRNSNERGISSKKR